VNVTLVERYDPAWPSWFDAIRAELAAALGELALAIEHVGSTAVPGMTAKPIIDIDVVIAQGALGAAVAKLSELGYVHQGDLGVPEREAFGLTDRARLDRLPPHHLYVCPKDSRELHRHLSFRDYLTRHPEWANELAGLKWSLCETNANDRQAYIDGKSLLVQHITRLAQVDFEGPIAAGDLVLEPILPEHAGALFAELQAPELYAFIPHDPPGSAEALAERYRRWAARQSPDGKEI
jgi:GrpB-like predicted nucleotidyltransferase (UPF0157 family)